MKLESYLNFNITDMSVLWMKIDGSFKGILAFTYFTVYELQLG
jgi:hypothetical protein